MQVHGSPGAPPLTPGERLASALRQSRADMGIGQAEVAILVRGVRSRIADYESGSRLPPPGELYRLADLYAEHGPAIVSAWVEARGSLPIAIYSETVPRYPHPLALQVATSFAAWWPRLARAETAAARGALSVMRWALSRLGDPPPG